MKRSYYKSRALSQLNPNRKRGIFFDITDFLFHVYFYINILSATGRSLENNSRHGFNSRDSNDLYAKNSHNCYPDKIPGINRFNTFLTADIFVLRKNLTQ